MSGSVGRDLSVLAVGEHLSVAGSVGGNLSVWRAVGEHLAVSGSVGGDLSVRGSVSGDLAVSGSVGRNLDVSEFGSVGGNLTVQRSGSVGGYLVVSGSVGRNLDVSGSVGRNLDVSGSVGGNLDVSGSVGGELVVSGSVGGDLTVRGVGSVGGNLDVSGTVSGSLAVLESGSVGRSLTLQGSVGEHLTVAGSVGGNLDVSGSVGGNLDVSGSVEDRVVMSGRANSISLVGRFADGVLLTPSEGAPVPLLSVRRGRFSEEVFVGERVSIDRCDMRQCGDLALFNLVGRDLFPDHRRTISREAREADSEETPHREMAAIYRQLRTNLEDRRNRPAARGFYVAEMDSRRWAATEEGRAGKPARTEAAVLWAYHLLARYGQSVRLPALWFVLIALVGAVAMAIGGVDLTPSFPLAESTIHDGLELPRLVRQGLLSDPQAACDAA